MEINEIPSIDFLDDESIQRLKSSIKNCSGYCILIDIKDSARRKRKYSQTWILQTEELYKAFDRMCQEIRSVSSTDVLIKYTGDGALAFFNCTGADPKSRENQPDISMAVSIMKYLIAFKSYISTDMEDILCNMQLKIVVCYLAGVNVISIKNNRDVLGRGIDFVFRLEKFADASHIVLNDMIKQILCAGNTLKIGDNIFTFINIRKKMKGWGREEQSFWILTHRPWVEDAIETMVPSALDDHVLIELFRYFMKESYRPEKEEDVNWGKDNGQL